MPAIYPPLREHYGSLDGLRAYAAIGIVMMHVLANISLKPSTNYLTNTIIPYFTDFVFLFMMISGFSVSCGYYEKIKNHMISPNDFYLRRYKRILPFFAIMVLIDLLWERNLNFLFEGFADLTLCFGLYPNADIKVIGVGWFIGLAFVFYLLYPFFTFLLDNKRRGWMSLIICLGLCMTGIYYFGNDVCVEHPMEFKRGTILYSAPYFMVGGIIYLYRDSLKTWVDKNYWTMLGLCVIISIAHFIFKNKGLFVLQSLIFFATWLIYALGSKDKVLNNNMVRYLSKISMEIYLCHMLFFRVVEKIHLDHLLVNSNLLYLCTCVLTLVLAILFSHICKFKIINRIAWLR